MSGALGEAERWGQPARPPKTSGSASLAVAAGVMSFVCLFGVGGLVAIALGWAAHAEIERSQGQVTGKGLATAGIALGIANVVLSVVAVGVLVALAVRPDPSTPLAAPLRSAPALPSPVRPPSLDTQPIPGAEADGPGPEAGAERNRELPPLAPRVGKILVVEAEAGAEALETQLLAQLRESAKTGEQVVLWTVASRCEPCTAVGRALPDARMQRALAKVRLFRADAASFSAELQDLGVPVDNLPGFTLLDARAHALDHIHGGEWDADIPANMAPVLDRFLRHHLNSRRHPWARPLRQGETPL